MNRNIFLILSAVTVIVLLAIWVYLLFFANQGQNTQNPIQETGEFNDFDLGNDVVNSEPQSDTSEVSTQPGQSGNPNNYDPDILRQLTTKNVAGYEEVRVASSTYVYFMESGVGHIYAIDLATGIEERISATTIPNAREASFTLDGQYVAVKVGDDTGPNDLLIGSINLEETSTETSDLAANTTVFTFTEEGTLLYGTLANASVIVNAYDVANKTTRQVFSTPFREATVLLAENVTGPHYFYPKTSALLEGFVYQVSDGVTKRLPADGFGLTANGSDGKLVVSKRDIAQFVTEFYDLETDGKTLLSNSYLPSKCVIGSTIYCASDGSELTYLSTDNWLRGEVNYADSLWLVNEEESTLLINITAFSGRNVDVTHNQIGYYNDDWYFKNKIDNTLWIFETSRLQENSTGETN